MHHHLLCGVSGLWAPVAGDDGLLHRGLGMVRLLPLSLCQARRAVHHVLAQATGLLTVMATALFIAALLVLPAFYARDSARERRLRGGWFTDALPLFDSYQVVQQGRGWRVLTGRYQGSEVRLEPV